MLCTPEWLLLRAVPASVSNVWLFLCMLEFWLDHQHSSYSTDLRLAAELALREELGQRDFDSL